jgi:hypothetical protein
MDWWVAVGVVLVLCALLASIPLVIWQDFTLTTRVVATLVLLATILYVIDLTFFTFYRLDSEGLSIVSQLRHFYFPYRTMSQIQQDNLFGLVTIGRKKRFALSANCLKIKMVNGQFSAITVSPRKKQEFIEELLKRIEAERTARATVSRK